MKRYAIISIFFVCLFSIVITGSNAQSNPQFVDNDDGTVTDTANGLMWIKSTPSPLLKHAVTWFEAKNESENLNKNSSANVLNLMFLMYVMQLHFFTITEGKIISDNLLLLADLLKM